MQCILEKIILGTWTVRGYANDWHHIGVVIMITGNTGAVAVANSLLMRLQLAEVVDTRVDDDITQFAFVALFSDDAATAVVVVVNVVATAVVVIVVVDYGSR